jgi:hypothetical protein
MKGNKYTKEEKELMYSRWYNYQESRGFPTPEYPPQAYTDSIYDIWTNVMAVTC